MAEALQRYLVTGAAGFVGRRLAIKLLEKGVAVRTLDLEPLDLPGVEHVQGDIREEEVLLKALDGIDVVFHVASYISMDPREDAAMYEINIVANQKLLDLSRRLGVTKFIYTSSIDVVYEGKPIRRGDETLPYPKKFIDYYAYSKATAEQAVLNTHNPLGMLTCSLRPAGIYGPGDHVRLPVLMESVRQNVWITIGKGEAEFNHVYVDNLVHAHLQVAEALTPDSMIGGQAYFITDHEPTFFYDFFNPIFAGLGYRIKPRRLPYWFAMTLAKVLVWHDQLPWNKGKKAPKLTPYTVASTARDFSFVHDKATEDFGYEPIVSLEEALKATTKDLRERGYAAHASNNA